MALELLDVQRTSPDEVICGEPIVIRFKVDGAVGVPGFKFPFSNESLTESLLEFLENNELIL